jgi:nucleoside 2-deoxyribosyltransferase
VFLPDPVEIGRRKAEICARHGLVGLYPLDNTVNLAATDASLVISRGNEAMMRSADASIANLTPGRGPRLGYMAGLGKYCLGYCNDPALYVDRVRRIANATPTDGRLTDTEGLTVEDFGLNDNLMIVHALDLHGAPLVLPRQALADPWHDLTAFEVCVRMAAEHFGVAPSRI